MMRAALAVCLLAAAHLPAEARKIKKPLPSAQAPVEAQPTSSFDANEATRQIRARMGTVRACYERVSKHEPGLEGKLQLGFDISEVGQVSATNVEVDGLRVLSRAGANELTGCIRNQALGWRLAPEGPVGGAHVSYVFVFAASN